MNFDDLLGIVDVEPVSERLPAIGNHLNQHAARRRLKQVRNSLLVRFDVLLCLFVLDEPFFVRLHVHAGIFHRHVRVAAGDRDG